MAADESVNREQFRTLAEMVIRDRLAGWGTNAASRTAPAKSMGTVRGHERVISRFLEPTAVEKHWDALIGPRPPKREPMPDTRGPHSKALTRKMKERKRASV